MTFKLTDSVNPIEADDAAEIQNVVERLRRTNDCVSITTLSTERGVARARAAQWLRAAALRPPTTDQSMRMTYCQVTRGEEEDSIPCTNFQLVTQPLTANAAAMEDRPVVALSSVAENGAEQLLGVAHERDQAAWRDAMQRRQPPMAISDDDDWRIRPAPPIRDAWHTQGASVVPAPSDVAPLRAGVVTTAAQFFGVKKGTAEDGKENHQVVARKTTTLEKKHAVPDRTKGMSKPVEPSTASKNVGTVDDFMGDMDDDDDDDEMMMEDDAPVQVVVAPKSPPHREAPPPRKRGPDPSKASTTRTVASPPAVRDDPPKGALDAFVQHSAEPVSQHRAKVLVEQTTVDEHGYLRTVQVWQEAPVSTSKPETRPVGAVRPAPKTKKTTQSHLKQGSLKGFFAKK